MAHRLDPLLRPRSIAFVGASTRPDSVGRTLIQNIRHGGFVGPVYAVNPRYDDVESIPCYPSLHALPEPVEHVVLAISDRQIEAAFDAAIAQGARAVTIFSSLVSEQDEHPPLAERIRKRAQTSGVLVCGAMGMGFYNFVEKLWVCGFTTRLDHRAGNVALVTQSGSVFNALVDCEARIDYNLVVSSGLELNVTVANYLDFTLDMPSTRVVGVLLETVRDPQRFVAALKKANQKGVPVVALKVGRSERAGKLAASHSGAMVGHDDVYQSLFDRYGVIRCYSLDEMAFTLIMFAQPHPVSPGGLATIHDSGGERALLVDIAEDLGVPFARLSDDTRERLQARLDPGLRAINPLDAWGTGHDYEGVFADCLSYMMQDPETAIGAIVCDRGPHGKIFPEYPRFARAANQASGKPVFLISSHQGSGFSADAISVTREGFPTLDGIPNFIKGVKHLFAYRDFQARAPITPPSLPDGVAHKWQTRLQTGEPVDRLEAMRMLSDFGLPVVDSQLVATRDEALMFADSIGCPVVLKTAELAIAHKSDVDGVRLNLSDAASVADAYAELAACLGERMLVAPMVTDGVTELMFGLVNDEQFGPVVLVGSGSIHAEILRDVVFALPPFDRNEARRLVERLKLKPLLEGVHGLPPADIECFCEAAARFSMLAATVGPAVKEIDVNPVIVRQHGCVAVDVLVVPLAPCANSDTPGENVDESRNAQTYNKAWGRRVVK